MPTTEDILAEYYSDPRRAVGLTPQERPFNPLHTPPIEKKQDELRKVRRPADPFLAGNADTLGGVLDYIGPDADARGAFGLGGLLAESADYLRQGRPGDIDPMSIAGLFVGRAGAGNLAKAGRRHPDDWGGINRLPDAQRNWELGDRANMSPAQSYRETGWTPPYTWGKAISPFKAEPATVIPTHDFNVNWNKFQPMKVGDREVLRAEGPFSQLMTGASLDDLLTAEPRMGSVSTMFTVDPRLPQPTGATSISLKWPGNVKRHNSKPESMYPSQIRADSPTKEGLLPVAPHEGQHGFAVLQGLAPFDPNVAQGMSPIRGTKAEATIRAKVDAMAREYDRAVSRNGPDSLEANVLWTRMQRAVDQLERAPGRAGYLNEPGERLAREAYLRWRETSGMMTPFEAFELNRNWVPGEVDTYRPGVGAMPAKYERDLGAPLPEFDPRRRD